MKKARQASEGKQLSAGRRYSHIWWRPRPTGTPRVQLHGFTQQLVRDWFRAAGYEHSGPPTAVGEGRRLSGHCYIERKAVVWHEPPWHGQASDQALVHLAVPGKQNQRRERLEKAEGAVSLKKGCVKF